MNILIAGDFFISDDFRNKEIIDQTVIDLFQKADYRMVNLEAPITDNKPKNKILKTGPHLRMSEDTIIPYLKRLRVDGVTLANNHILDYGAIGLVDTFNSLTKNQIKYVGAGNNLAEASKPLSIEKEGMKIAILNFCENEWSIARKDSPGANPMDIIDNTKLIKTAKATHDKVICIIHGGHEYYNLPSPRMQKQYSFYVDNGADAIVGHHTHCISGFEIYKNAPILYSIGNFIFTLNSKKEDWYTGLLVRLRIDDKKETIKIELMPVVQENKTFQTSLARNEIKKEIINEVELLSEIIDKEDQLAEGWRKFINHMLTNSLNNLSLINSIKNRYVRVALRKLGINKVLLNKSFLKLIFIIMRCESHSELTISAITKKIRNKAVE